MPCLLPMLRHFSACSMLRFHSLGLLPSLRQYSAFSMRCFSFALPVALSAALMRSVGESLFIFPSVQFSYVTGLYAPPEALTTSPKKPTSSEAHRGHSSWRPYIATAGLFAAFCVLLSIASSDCDFQSLCHAGCPCCGIFSACYAPLASPLGWSRYGVVCISPLSRSASVILRLVALMSPRWRR